MTLDQFIESEKKRVERFAAYYREQRAGTGDSYVWPLKMDEGEWDEQYRCYSDE